MTLFWSEIYAQDHGKALIGVAGRGESPPNSIPTDEQIEEWWKPECREHRDERLEVKEVKPVGLKNGEKAFAASVRFPERAHCWGSGILLVRPDLQEARQTHELDQVDKAMDLDGDGVDEVLLTLSHTGQGVNEDGHSLIQIWRLETYHPPFAGIQWQFWRPLQQVGERDILPFQSSDLTFTDLDADGVKDLVETIVDTDGDEYDQPDQLTRTTKVNLYSFKDNKFVLVPPSWTPAKIPEQSRDKSGDDNSAHARDNRSRGKQAGDGQPEDED
jgi:hypothetical protein